MVLKFPRKKKNLLKKFFFPATHLGSLFGEWGSMLDCEWDLNTSEKKLCLMGDG